MPTMDSKPRTLLRGIVEAMARMVIGEPARIIGKRELERLERLAYREQLMDAELQGDAAFVEAEIQRNQLTPADRRGVARRHTPIADWPDTDPGLVDPSLFEPSQPEREAL